MITNFLFYKNEDILTNPPRPSGADETLMGPRGGLGQVAQMVHSFNFSNEILDRSGPVIQTIHWVKVQLERITGLKINRMLSL